MPKVIQNKYSIHQKLTSIQFIPSQLFFFFCLSRNLLIFNWTNHFLSHSIQCHFIPKLPIFLHLSYFHDMKSFFFFFVSRIFFLCHFPFIRSKSVFRVDIVLSAFILFKDAFCLKKLVTVVVLYFYLLIFPQLHYNQYNSYNFVVLKFSAMTTTCTIY